MLPPPAKPSLFLFPSLRLAFPSECSENGEMSSVTGSSSLTVWKQCFSLLVWAASGAQPSASSREEATTSDSWTELNCLVSNSEPHSGTVTYDSHYIPYPSALHTHTMRKFILKNWPTVWLPQFSMIEEPRYTNRTICFPTWVLSLVVLPAPSSHIIYWLHFGEK